MKSLDLNNKQRNQDNILLVAVLAVFFIAMPCIIWIV